MDEQDRGARIVASYLAELRAVTVWENLTGFEGLDALVPQESQMWLARFLTPEASPYRDFTRVQRFIHRSTGLSDPDLLRHVYRGAGHDLVVTESATWVHVLVSDVDVLAVPPDAPPEKAQATRASRLQDLARAVLRTEGTRSDDRGGTVAYAWRFAFPDPVQDGSTYRTGSEDPTFMWSWADRVDGGIRARQPWFLLHKTRPVTSGRVVRLNASEWFSGRCWDVYRSERRR
jgi:hypothetical protein